MSVVPIHELPSRRENGLSTGTLVWIGDTTLPEFRPAFEFFVNHAAQIAPRSSIQQAIARPASDVRGVVLARNHRFPVSPGAIAQLHQLCGEAKWVDLLGPLALGIRQSSHPQSRRVAWQHWQQELPGCFAIASPAPAMEGNRNAVRSVLVIASHWDAAEPYLELADSHRIAAVWSPVADGQRFRNLDAVWWDDSAAPIADALQWRQRLDCFDQSASIAPRHVWIGSGVGFPEQEQAMQAGVQEVIGKPYRIEALLGMLADEHPASRSERVAA